MPKRLTLAALFALSLPLAACGGPPTDPIAVTTLYELQDYVTKAGVNCDDLEDRGQVPLIDDSQLGACSDDVVLAIFPNHTQTKVWSYSIHDLGRDMEQRVLIGEAWAVSAKAEILEDVQLTTGGVIVTDEMLDEELENH